MPASSNFNQAIREAQTSSIVGPNVVQKALPYVGGGMVLTSLGVLAGVSLIATNPGLFQPLSTRRAAERELSTPPERPTIIFFSILVLLLLEKLFSNFFPFCVFNMEV